MREQQTTLPAHHNAPWLLLSAYRSDSHAAWADWLCDTFSDRHWLRLELPGRHFRWRIRGNPLSWLDQIPADPPAAIIATSMVDLATLRGLHPQLAHAPTLYYFHENQFAYPAAEAQHSSVDPQMVQLYGALAADRLAFNSAWNRDSFLAGVQALLARLPDALPGSVAERLMGKCTVCPVPVHNAGTAAKESARATVKAARPGSSPRRATERERTDRAPRTITGQVLRDPKLILWNHRWEYDKDPALFAEAMLELAAAGVAFRLALLGKRPSRTPEALASLRAQLGEQIIADGHLDKAEYAKILARSSIVVSTARHEFQGLSVLEAARAGATPLVPDALAYREQYAPTYRYPAGDRAALCAKLQDWLRTQPPPAPDVDQWSDEALSPQWHALLEALEHAQR